MKLLVTGGCGFVGTNVCEYYKKQGATVVAFDNLTKFELKRTGYLINKARDYNTAFLKSLHVNIAKEDVRDKEAVEHYGKNADYIIHTAAQPAMTIALEQPELDFSTNAVGALNICEVVRKYKVPTVCCATIHIYGNAINSELTETKTQYTHSPIAIDESYPIAGGTLTPLHVSKLTEDLLVKAYADSYHLPIASFRLTGLYGPKQFGGEDHGWVANFAIRAIFDKDVRIFGTGKQTRDILYVSDLISAFDRYYVHQAPGIYNVGGGAQNRISLIECIRLIESILNKKIHVTYDEERTGDLKYFVCNTKKAQTALHWQPKVLPEEGVTRLIKWIQKNKELFYTKN
jgi:CDP-paratose 2-epimerase